LPFFIAKYFRTRKIREIAEDVIEADTEEVALKRATEIRSADRDWREGDNQVDEPTIESVEEMADGNEELPK
jgi:hypothetical protein